MSNGAQLGAVVVRDFSLSPVSLTVHIKYLHILRADGNIGRRVDEFIEYVLRSFSKDLNLVYTSSTNKDRPELPCGAALKLPQ
jgi:hypothetical protein